MMSGQLQAFLKLIETLTTLDQVVQAMEVAKDISAECGHTKAWNACLTAMERVNQAANQQTIQQNKEASNIQYPLSYSWNESS